MNEKDLDIIKSRTLVLHNRERSNKVVLVDPVDGDMFLTFELRYINDTDHKGQTLLNASDDHHVEVIIETLPNSITKPSTLIELGTYGSNRPLYLGFVVQPQIGDSGEHNVVITLYAGKEVFMFGTVCLYPQSNLEGTLLTKEQVEEISNRISKSVSENVSKQLEKSISSEISSLDTPDVKKGQI